MANRDKEIVDLDNLPKTGVKSFGDIVDKFYASLPDVSSPLKNFDYNKLSRNNLSELSYNKDRGTLNVKGEVVKFTVNRKMADVLQTIFSGDLGRELAWDEIIESWEESKADYESPKKANDMIYNTGKNINKRVATETSNKNFLIVTYKKIKINPKYIS